jgi:hypothetical protein
MSSANTTSNAPVFASAPPGEDPDPEGFDDDEPCRPVIVWDAERDWYLDQTEEVWMTAKQIGADPRFRGERTVFQRAAAANRFGLRDARRASETTGDFRLPHATGTRRFRQYLYPLWRVEAWSGLSPSRPLPSINDARALRTRTDTVASQLALQVGFSAEDVRRAVVAGDLNAGFDHGSGKLLFVAPGTAEAWINRDAWQSLRAS